MSTTLTDVCSAIVDCEHKTAPAGDGFALSVGTRAMKDGRLVLEACKPVSEDTYNLWTRRLVPEDGDLILAREAPVGDVIRIPRHPRVCLGQRTVLIRPDPQRVDPRFLHYWLLGPTAQTDMYARAAGATVAHLNVEDIRALDVSTLPADLAFQHQVGSILGAIDDLIENSRRRIALLEQMARAIYREWFVQFRYPGHEDDELVDSQLGPIPTGWNLESLKDLAWIVMGQSPRSEYYNESGDGLPFHQGVSNFGPHYPRHRLYCRVEGRMAQAGDHLVSVRAPVGRLNRADQRIVIGRGLAAVRSRDGFQALLGQQLRQVFREEDAMGGGTIFKAITKGDLEGIEIAQPTDIVARLAEEALEPIDCLIRSLTFGIRALEGARDLLLPKLVTGAIDVSRLDLDGLLDESAL